MDSKRVLGDGVIWVVLLRHGGHWAPCGGNIWARSMAIKPVTLRRYPVLLSLALQRGNRKLHHNTYHLLSARNDHHTGPPFFFVQSLIFITFIPVVSTASCSVCLSVCPPTRHPSPPSRCRGTASPHSTRPSSSTRSTSSSRSSARALTAASLPRSTGALATAARLRR